MRHLEHGCSPLQPALALRQFSQAWEVLIFLSCLLAGSGSLLIAGIAIFPGGPCVEVEGDCSAVAPALASAVPTLLPCSKRVDEEGSLGLGPDAPGWGVV